MGMIFLDILEFCEPRDVAVNDMIGGEPRLAQHLAPSRNVKILYRYHLSLLYSSTSIQQAPIDSIGSSTRILVMWNGPEIPLQLRPIDSTSCKR